MRFVRLLNAIIVPVLAWDLRVLRIVVSFVNCTLGEVDFQEKISSTEFEECSNSVQELYRVWSVRQSVEEFAVQHFTNDSASSVGV